MTVRAQLEGLLRNAQPGHRLVVKFDVEGKMGNKRLCQEMAQKGCFKIEQWQGDEHPGKVMYLVLEVKALFDPPWILDRLGRNILFVRNKNTNEEVRIRE